MCFATIAISAIAGFAAKVKVGQKVRRSEALFKMNLDKIHQAGYNATVITIIADNEANVEIVGKGQINPGQDLMKVAK